MLTQPSPEEREQARAGACLLVTFAVFGGPSVAHELFRGTEDGELPDWVDVDMVDGHGLPALEDAGRDVARAAHVVLEYGATLAPGEAPTEDEPAAYTDALPVLATTCEEQGESRTDGADRPLDAVPDDPAVRDMVECMQPSPAEGGQDGD